MNANETPGAPQDSPRTSPSQRSSLFQDQPENQERKKRSVVGPIVLVVVLALIAWGGYYGVQRYRASKANAVVAVNPVVQDNLRLAEENAALKKQIAEAQAAVQQAQTKIDEVRAAAVHPAGRPKTVAAEPSEDDGPKVNNHSAVLTKTGG